MSLLCTLSKLCTLSMYFRDIEKSCNAIKNVQFFVNVQLLKRSFFILCYLKIILGNKIKCTIFLSKYIEIIYKYLYSNMSNM